MSSTEPASEHRDTPINLAYNGRHWEMVKYFANTHHCDSKGYTYDAIVSIHRGNAGSRVREID